MAARASPSLLEHLKDAVAVIAEPMPGVTTKRMFGCDVWLVNGNLFVLLNEVRAGRSALASDER